MKLCIIGIGPHSKRIYLNYVKKHKLNLILIIDLESNKNSLEEYLRINDFKNINTWYLPDIYKDESIMPMELAENLLNIMKKLEVTHIISSTEPKGHHMYLDFAINNNIKILTDKPISVLKNMNEMDNIEMVRSQYYDLLKKVENTNSNCSIMCQRKFHRGYNYVKKILRSIVEKYNIPITYIDIYHCDGNWEMPHDMEKENHPYKYGYGKLYHSGYHFIDLLADFLKINNLTSNDKKIASGNLFGTVFKSLDENSVITKKDIMNIFKINELPSTYDNMYDSKYENYGEKNFYSQMGFYNEKKQLITSVTMNLLHTGFSRRGWFKSKDYYKNNGRIRHERINIQIGYLMNIQIHSYQSKEIKDRTNNEYEINNGGLEHFDIDIYRNVDLIGGKPFERIKLRDLYDTEISKNDFMGYNEYSREELLNAYLYEDVCINSLEEQKLAMEILYSASLVSQSKGKEVIDIKIPM